MPQRLRKWSSTFGWTGLRQSSVLSMTIASRQLTHKYSPSVKGLERLPVIISVTEAHSDNRKDRCVLCHCHWPWLLLSVLVFMCSNCCLSVGKILVFCWCLLSYCLQSRGCKSAQVVRGSFDRHLQLFERKFQWYCPHWCFDVLDETLFSIEFSLHVTASHARLCQKIF